ncbi:MAG: Transaldolase [Parcubacteria group bacterium GW2011_GWA2_47_8]|nr:MAG: Transaldolase [Parcubacteria group bacterium GW2011_GWA2_47_8]
MRPRGLQTKIFLDSGDPAETQHALKLLGFLDGQTTNPSLIAKNPQVEARIKNGKKFMREEINDFYRQVIQEIRTLIPAGSISVEVYADSETKNESMIADAQKFFVWAPNLHIKLPLSREGLKAMTQATQQHIQINATLCFNQGQAAAVYNATQGAKEGSVYLSPFIGRLDDQMENGMDLIANILRMYKQGDAHVEVLAASVRNYDHFKQCLILGTHIVTCPLRVLEEWAAESMPISFRNFVYDNRTLKNIPYQNVNLDDPWQGLNIQHVLTDKGLQKFADDWNGVLER